MIYVDAAVGVTTCCCFRECCIIIKLGLYSGTCGPTALTHCVAVNNGTSKMTLFSNSAYSWGGEFHSLTVLLAKGAQHRSNISSATHSFHLQQMVASTMVHSSRHSWDRQPTHLVMHHPMEVHQSRNLPPFNQRQPPKLLYHFSHTGVHTVPNVVYHFNIKYVWYKW
jgi:hypothetical protein